MSKWMRIWVVVICLFQAGNLLAGKKTKPAVIAASALALPVFLQGILIHESTHLISVKAVGAKVWDFRPYPHFEERYGRKFSFGWIVYGENYQFKYAGRYWPLHSQIAPYLNDFAMFAVADMILSNWETDSTFGRMAVLLCGMAAPLVDTFFNFTIIGNLPVGDINKFMQGASVDPKGVYMASNFLVVMGLWRAIHHAHRIFHGHKKENEKLEIGLMELKVRF